MIRTIDDIKARFIAGAGPNPKDWDDLIDTLFGFSGEIDGDRFYDGTVPITKISNEGQVNKLAASDVTGAAAWRLPEFGGALTGAMPSPEITRYADDVNDASRPVSGDNVKDASIVLPNLSTADADDNDYVIYHDGVVQWGNVVSAASSVVMLDAPVNIYTYPYDYTYNAFPHTAWASYDAAAAVSATIGSRTLLAAIVSLGGTISGQDWVGGTSENYYIEARPYNVLTAAVRISELGAMGSSTPTPTSWTYSAFSGHHIIPVASGKFEYRSMSPNGVYGELWRGGVTMQLIGYIAI